MTRTHSLFGSSNAHIWVNCPGSASLLKTVNDLPQDAPDKFMEDGTAKHEASELYLNDFLQYKTEGTDPEIRLHLSPYSEEIKEHAREYTEAVWRDVLEQTITGKAWAIEDRLVLHSYGDTDIAYGYADFWCCYINDKSQRFGHVLDAKFGYQSVPADESWQLKFLAVSLREEIRRAGKDLDSVSGSIYQPRRTSEASEGDESSDSGGNANTEGANKHPGTFIQTVTFTGKQLDTYKDKFEKAISNAHGEKPTFKIGEWCKGCRARGICPKYTKHLEARSGLTLQNATQIQLPAPDTLTPEQLTKVKLVSKELTDWIEQCNKYTYKMALAKPELFPELKFVRGKSRRKWGKTPDEIIKACQTYGIDAVKPIEVKSLTAIEKDAIKVIGRSEAGELMSQLTIDTELAPSLVAVTDKREAIIPNQDLLEAELE